MQINTVESTKVKHYWKCCVEKTAQTARIGAYGILLFKGLNAETGKDSLGIPKELILALRSPV